MENDPKLQIIWCDEAVLAVDKPAGVLVIADGYNPSLPHIKSLLESEFGRLWIVHRLDRDTSGVLLLGRSAEAHRSLNAQFEKHQVEKVYHGLVTGSPDWEEKDIRLPLRVDGDRKHRTIVDERGKPARTTVRVLERLESSTLVEARPFTGRTHQIRAHLAAVGLHLHGDNLYSPAHEIDFSNVKPGEQGSGLLEHIISRVGLHAYSISFMHPVNGKRQVLQAPYPSDFALALEQLRRRKTNSGSR